MFYELPALLFYYVYTSFNYFVCHGTEVWDTSLRKEDVTGHCIKPLKACRFYYFEGTVEVLETIELSTVEAQNATQTQESLDAKRKDRILSGHNAI